MELRVVEDIAVIDLGPSVNQNKITFEFLSELNRALDKVEKLENVKALITTASGKFYCNGIDLVMLYSLSSDEVKRFFHELHSALLRIMLLPFPTIAAVNGHAFAGGAFLTLAHDFCIMTNTKGWWCLNEIHVKMTFNPFLLELVRLKIPPGSVTTEAAVLGRRYTAERAFQAGLVQGYCEADKLMSTAMGFTHKLFASERFDKDTLRGIKEQMYGGLHKLVDRYAPSKL